MQNKSSAAGRFRQPIDPYAFTHQCDNRASYVPKGQRPPKDNWTSLTDSTGRGFQRQSKAFQVPESNTYKHYETKLAQNRYPGGSNMKTIIN